MTVIHEIKPSINKRKVIDLSNDWNDKLIALEKEFKRQTRMNKRKV